MNTPTVIDQSAKQFLARVVAWPQDGEPLAYVNVHNTFVPEDKTTLRKEADGTIKYPWSGIACRNLNEAARLVSQSNGKAHVRDVYFCTSTQRFCEEKVGKRGYKYLKAVRSAENAVKMKAIFIDIDLTDGKKDKSKGYDDIKQLKEAFAKFVADTGLPRPTLMVFSGGGLHVYWTLQEAITVDKWLPLAYALADATKRHGLKCDTACTIDSARILRVPGTLNHKYDPPRKVTLLGNPLDFDYLNAKIEAILEPYKVSVPYSMVNGNMSILPPKPALTGTSDLSAGIDMSGLAPVDLDSLLDKCGFLYEAVDTGGADYNNPLWNLTTMISVFTEGGRVDAHRMALGHVNYGPGETDDLFDRKMEERVKKNMGWPRCATIAQTGSTHCASCPLFAQNKSPLNFGTKAGQQTQAFQGPQVVGGFSNPQATLVQGATTPAQVPATQQAGTLGPSTSTQDPDLPPGYLRNQNGVILYPQEQEDGTTVWLPLSRYAMSSPFLLKDPEWSINFISEMEQGRTCTISIPTEVIGSSEMRKALQKQGFMVMGGTRGFNQMAEFLLAWINKLQSMKDTVLNPTPFGWVTSQGKTVGFVYGGQKYTPNGPETATPSDPELARQFSPHGDTVAWKRAALMVTDQHRPALDAIIASAFAAPLVRFTGHAGLLMSAYSFESGIGKSTALKIAQAVWGDPVRAVQSLSDTQNSVLNKMGELRSLPMYWDELKSEDDTKKFVDTVFRLTLGKEKSRMTARVTQRHVGSWETMLVSASNESLLDTIAYKTRATTAGIYRVFEYTVAPAPKGSIGQIDPTAAQRVIAKLHDNYGGIGLEYAGYLGGNVAQVDKDVSTMLAKVSKDVNMQADERFWVGTIGTVMLGAKYANALGFTDIDEVSLQQFMYSTLTLMRQARTAAPVDMRDVNNVGNMLSRFLNENRKNTLITNEIYRGRGKPAQGTISIVADASKLDTLHVHVGRDDHCLRFGAAYFQDWLTKNNYPRHVIMKAVETELGAKVLSARLGAGTYMAGGNEFLLELDLKKHAIMNFIDEA